jgi:hypothetical protein
MPNILPQMHIGLSEGLPVVSADVIAVPTPATHKLAAAPNVATLNSTAEKQAWRENIRCVAIFNTTNSKTRRT